MWNRKDILTKPFLCGSERQRLKRGDNTTYRPSERNDLPDMQVLETISLEIWMLCCQVFKKFLLKWSLLIKQDSVHFSCTTKRLSLTLYITLLTKSLFIFFSISTVHVSFGISFVSLTFPRSFFIFSFWAIPWVA